MLCSPSSGYSTDNCHWLDSKQKPVFLQCGTSALCAAEANSSHIGVQEVALCQVALLLERKKIMLLLYFYFLFLNRSVIKYELKVKHKNVNTTGFLFSTYSFTSLIAHACYFVCSPFSTARLLCYHEGEGWFLTVGMEFVLKCFLCASHMMTARNFDLGRNQLEPDWFYCHTLKADYSLLC